MRTLFITGTDTGVGKTHVAAMIIQELQQQGIRTGAFKPACSGAIVEDGMPPRWDDIDRLAAALAVRVDDDLICPQRYLAPLAPPLAALREQRSVDLAAIDRGLQAWKGHCEALIVEGAGGWLCPLTDTHSFADWVARWKMPVLIVARRGLGTINHTLLTIAGIRRQRLPITGVILNQTAAEEDDFSVVDNPSELEARSGVPVLGQILWNRSELQQGDRAVRMHWWSLMGESGIGS